MKVEDLELFTTIVRLGGFTAAANALELPRSNVSRRISKLEEELNLKLFFRTTRQISLTQYGKSYYEEVVKALETLNRARLATDPISDVPKGRIKIGLLPETDEAISPLLFLFLDKYPEIELDIRSINNGFIDTYQQDLDLAFHAGEVIDSNLVAREITGLNGRIVASPDYIEKYGRPEQPHDLSDHSCICFRWPNGQVVNCWPIAGEEVMVRGKLTSNSIGLIKRAALNGRGLAFLPKLFINAELKDNELISLLNDFENPFNSEKVWLLYPETKGISRATRLLIEYLVKEVPKIS